MEVPGMRFWEDAHPPQGGRSDMRGTAPAEEFNFVISESCRVRGWEGAGWPLFLPSCVIMTADRVNLVYPKFRQTVLCVCKPFPKNTHTQRRGSLENNQTTLVTGKYRVEEVGREGGEEAACQKQKEKLNGPSPRSNSSTCHYNLWPSRRSESEL